jgi:hypothetical protein
MTSIAAGATRRDLAVWLTLTPVASGAISTLRAAEAPADGFPSGTEAAPIAATAVTRSWGRVTGYAEAVLRHWQRRRLQELLEGYARIHAARLGRPASATHLISVGDVIGASGRGFRALGASFRGSTVDFDPGRFALVWRQARMIDLAQGAEQQARIVAAITPSTSTRSNGPDVRT